MNYTQIFQKVRQAFVPVFFLPDPTITTGFHKKYFFYIFSSFSTLILAPRFSPNVPETGNQAILSRICENLSPLFFSLFVSKKVLRSSPQKLYFHFSAIFNPNFSIKTTLIFLFLHWNQQRLLKMLILHEKLVFS